MPDVTDEKFCITIERGFGSGGKTVGIMLAERLGIEYYDRDLSRLSSEFSGIDERLFVQFDKTVRSRLFRKYSAADLQAILSPDDEKFVSDDNLFRLQAKVISDLAGRESCIILGRCSGFVLGGKPNVLRVYIHAPLDNCAENARERYGVSPDEARRLVQNADANRRKYFKYYTGGLVWEDAANYDLTINTAELTFEQAADIIMEVLKIRGLLKQQD